MSATGDDTTGSAAEPTSAPAGRARLSAAAGLISTATMLSRLLGLAREALFAALMGASMFADAFVAAFRVPNLLRDLFAEGALSQAFVPTFKHAVRHEGRERAYLLADRIAGTLVVVTGAMIGAAAVFTPELLGVMAGGFEATPGKLELAVELTRIMLPFLTVLSLAAVAMGMLNAQDRYAAPALAPAMFNVCSIAVGGLLWATGVADRAAAIGWAIGTMIGGVAQLAVQVPSLWRLGYRPRPRSDLRLRDPAVRRVALLMLPAVVGVASVQVNVFVNTMFATTEPGAVTWLNFAFRFLQLPIGVFGVAIATVSTTRYADAAADGDRAAVGRQLEDSLRLTVFLCLPATVGLVVLSDAIIALIYGHGRFTAPDVAATAAALRLYAIGLVAYAAVKVLAPAYYAVGRARIPMLASVGAVAGNVVLNVALHPAYGFRALALGTALAATLNFAALYAAFGARVAPVRHGRLVGYLLRIGVAAAVMGGIVLIVERGLGEIVGGPSLLARAIRTLVPIGAGALAYAGACRALGVEEAATLLARLRRWRRRRG